MSEEGKSEEIRCEENGQEVMCEKKQEEVKCEEKREENEEKREENENKQEDEKPEIKTKQYFRERIWVHMAKEKLVNSFLSLCNKIPYFKGCDEATKRLSELEEYKKTKLLMISPDKPQKSVIILSLQNGKEILIPRPRLYNGLFHHVKNASESLEENGKNVITRHDIKQIQTPVNFDTTDLKVDMLVLGSVCVNKAGYRIGDGEGFVDLEYAILSKMKAVNENTILVTTVHDCQILDDLPNELFAPYDVPVDIIVTPTQTIFVDPKLNKPTEIIWSIISKRRLAAIPILNEIKQSEEKKGNALTLKEDDSDTESHLQEKIRINKLILKLKPKSKRSKSTSNNVFKENEKNKEMRRIPFFRRRKLRKSKENEDGNNLTNPQTNDVQSNAKASPGKSPRRRGANWGRHQIDFSLRLSNIAATVRVRDLKSALLERGVKPSNITWRGQRGFCLLHFGKLRKRDGPEDQPIQVDSIVANLQQLKIGDTTPNATSAFITVEPAEPVTRIEVTDVSNV